MKTLEEQENERVFAGVSFMKDKMPKPTAGKTLVTTCHLHVRHSHNKDLAQSGTDLTASHTSASRMAETRNYNIYGVRDVTIQQGYCTTIVRQPQLTQYTTRHMIFFLPTRGSMFIMIFFFQIQWCACNH